MKDNEIFENCKICGQKYVENCPLLCSECNHEVKNGCDCTNISSPKYDDITFDEVDGDIIL